jgi:twitching motility protein PilI
MRETFSVEAIALLRTAGAAAITPRALQAMTPTQALTAGFDLESASAGASDEPSAQRLHGTSRVVGERRRQGLRVGDLGLMIRYEDGSELTEMPAIYRLPNVPDWFCGFANLHGVLTPVFELSRYLGIEHDPHAKRMLLVLSRGANAAGVVIDGMPERLHWPDDDAADLDTAPRRLAPHVRGAYLVGERLWFDLDCDALLGALEQEMETPH